MRARTVLASLLCLLSTAPAAADVQVILGATPIRDGDARAAGDITLVNDRLAVALAVQSPPAYGVPRGALVDAAPVGDGRIGRDVVEFADFIPNSWSAWPNTYRRVEILERGPQRAIVKIERDWGKITISTIYQLEDGSDHLDIRTTMRNDGDTLLRDALSGLTLWTNGGHLFAVPGMAGVESGKTESALADWAVAYDADWMVALHAGYLDHIESGSRDLFQLHSLAPWESREFHGWLQLGPRGDLAPVIRAEIARKQLAAGTVRGKVSRRDGTPIEEPFVVIEKRGLPYGWAMGNQGHYELNLPPGEYTLHATARHHSSSASLPVTIAPGSDQTVDFTELQPPGRLRLTIKDARSRERLDARIAIVKGQQPLIEFLGRRVFFTELDPRGLIDIAIAPGDYSFRVSAGGRFLGPAETFAASVKPGRSLSKTLALTRPFSTRARGWYSADLHHHADQAEGATPPVDLVRSQLAAGLDVLFVSDHDSTVNFRVLQDIAQQRGVTLIRGIELSPSWGHFNAYPLRLDALLSIDVGTATVAQVLAEGRRLGASVIQANHPFIPYGYLTSAAAGVAPGGYSGNFELLEINAGSQSDDRKVLARLWEHWNKGERYFLSAGSDTHNVWTEESGLVRIVAHVPGPLTDQSFAQALKDGRSYVTFGPLIFPSVPFGDRLRHPKGAAFKLGFELKSTAGLRLAELICRGEVVDSITWADSSRQEVRVDFALTADQSTWCSLIVRDRAGRKAYSNPIWIDVASTASPGPGA
jgi:hypothetical protein